MLMTTGLCPDGFGRLLALTSVHKNLCYLLFIINRFCLYIMHLNLSYIRGDAGANVCYNQMLRPPKLKVRMMPPTDDKEAQKKLFERQLKMVQSSANIMLYGEAVAEPTTLLIKPGRVIVFSDDQLFFICVDSYL